MSPVAAGILLLIDVEEYQDIASNLTRSILHLSVASKRAHVYNSQWARHNYDCATPPVYSDFDFRIFNMAMMAPEF